MIGAYHRTNIKKMLQPLADPRTAAIIERMKKKDQIAVFMHWMIILPTGPRRCAAARMISMIIRTIVKTEKAS